MLNMSDIIRGYTDTIILARLSQGDSYGYQINKTVSEKTAGQYELKEATLYTAFRRLEQDGCIASYWGDENTGARRRYYSITDRGSALWGENKEDWKSFQGIINLLLEADDDE